MKAIQPRVLAALALAALTSLGACVDGETDTGTVGIELVGQASSGATYRLRDAVITVQGPASTLVWNTEDDPDRTSLSANVVVGSYTATLATGWRLERLVSGGPPVTVVATLESPNPLAFEVLPMQRTSVPLRFAVEGGVVDMSQGYDIVLEVDDTATTNSIVTTVAALSVNEAGTAVLGVRLANQPASSVTVQVTSSDPSAVATTPVFLLFTPASYATPQLVTVAGLDDVDVANETVTLVLSAPGLASTTVAVNVLDDDVQAILTTVTNLALVEGGAATFGVRLAAQPPGVITVQVVSSDASAVAVSPVVLTFTPANFNVYQAVTIVGVQDPDLANEAVTLTLVGPGLAPRTVAVLVTDDDAP